MVKIETKSRYEVIADLEEKKRQLIINREGLDYQLTNKKKELKHLKRELEDKEEETSDFENSMSSQKDTINELIKSVDDSLNRLTEMSTKK